MALAWTVPVPAAAQADAASAEPAAAGAAPRPLPRLRGAIELDGRGDDAAWRAVPPLPLAVYSPTHGAPPTESSEIRVAYDDRYIYALGVFGERHVAVQANSLYRDLWDGDDTFELLLDTFDDNTTAVQFITTPLGLKIDTEVYNDGEADARGNGTNNDWDAVWEVRSVRTADGWSTEMRIPLSSLRFQARDSVVTMGLLVSRYIARTNERHIYPDVPPLWSRGQRKPSQAAKVTLRGVHPRNPVYLTPYALARRSDPAGAPDAPARALGSGDVGGDLRYALAGNLTLDLTVNTDFAQAEADDQQVNLTRFSLFQPEKRQFFQERASVFDFGLGGVSRVFHSRRIGLDPAGEPLPILGGARVAGRVGAWDVGALTMQVDGAGGRRGENASVLRARRTMLNPYSYVGAITTSRFGPGGERGLAYGVDALLRVRGDDYLSIVWSQSFNRNTAAAGVAAEGSGSLARVEWERRRQEGLGYYGGFTYSGAGYDPALGFLRRRDFTWLGGGLSRTWLHGGASRFRTSGLFTDLSFFLDPDLGRTQTASVSGGGFASLKAGTFLQLALREDGDALPDTLRLGEARVPPGTYRYAHAVVDVVAGPGTLLRPTLAIDAGRFYDGWRASLALGSTWNPSSHLALVADYQLNRARFAARGQTFRGDVVRLRARAALDLHASLATLLQYTTATGGISANARLRYNLDDGRDLYLIYTRALSGDAALDATPQHTLILKASYQLAY